MLEDIGLLRFLSPVIRTFFEILQLPNVEKGRLHRLLLEYLPLPQILVVGNLLQPVF